MAHPLALMRAFGRFFSRLRPCVGVTLAALGCALAYAAEPIGAAAPRERLAFDDEWRFHLGDTAGAAPPEFDDRGWRRLDLPHDWSIEGERIATASSAGGGGFFPTGLGWYRKTFAVPAHWAGRRVAIEFEGAYRNAEVWINGHALGVHPYGYTPFRHDLTPHLKVGAANTLAVRLDNSAQPNSRFYSGSGLYRHVWLEITDAVHFAPWGVFVTTQELDSVAVDSPVELPALTRRATEEGARPELPVARCVSSGIAGLPTDRVETPALTRRATLRTEATLRNSEGSAQAVELEVTVLDPLGHAVASARRPLQLPGNTEQSVATDLPVPEAQLWSPASPVLYTVVTRLRFGARVVDEVRTPFGIRTVAVSAERGFELNGRELKLLGANVHHDHGPLGAAAFDAAEARKVRLLKEAGFNAVRTAHNPPSPAFLDACDRLGLLVVVEAFDGWAKKKSPHDYAEFFPEWWRRDLTALVRRDRNHPSVVLWSLGNEMYERGTAAGLELAQEMAALVRELDATRPVTAGLNGMGKPEEWPKLDPLFAALDIAGYNYEIRRVAADHARVPSRVMYSAESYLSEVFVNWEAAADHRYVVGDFTWSGIDYLGEAGIGRVFLPGEAAVPHWEGEHFPWHGAACGDLDLTGWRKPVSHYRNIVWDRGEQLYVAVRVPTPGNGGQDWSLSKWAPPPVLPSWTWPGREGRTLQVEVYSRCDAVRLSLNGRSLGERATGREQEFKAVFAVPYEAGVLRAVGLRGGREVEVCTLHTTGPAAAVRLLPEQTTLRADGQDLAFVVAEVVDAEGRRCFDAEMPLEFAVSGPGSIAGIGSGDMASPESYQANPRRVFQGRALLVVRATRATGELVITARAAGLPPATVALVAE